MADTFWQKQSAAKPLFPDLMWSRPENKQARGKLLVIGGNLHAFTAVSQAYGDAEKAGVGTVRALLPNSLQRSLARVFPEADFAASTPNGSFSRQALSELLDAAAWADGVLLAGDFGKNSETAVLLENFIQKYSGPLTLSGDSFDFFMNCPELLLQRRRTVLAGSFGQLQKLAASSSVVIKHDMNLSNLVERLHDWSQVVQTAVCLEHDGQAIVAVSGQVSTTPIKNSRTLTAYMTVWQLQHPGKLFEALTCAAYELAHSS